MNVKEIKRSKKRLAKLEHKYAVRHKTKGFIGFVFAFNIAIVRHRFPESKGYSVYRKR